MKSKKSGGNPLFKSAVNKVIANKDDINSTISSDNVSNLLGNFKESNIENLLNPSDDIEKDPYNEEKQNEDDYEDKEDNYKKNNEEENDEEDENQDDEDENQDDEDENQDEEDENQDEEDENQDKDEGDKEDNINGGDENMDIEKMKELVDDKNNIFNMSEKVLLVAMLIVGTLVFVYSVFMLAITKDTRRNKKIKSILKSIMIKLILIIIVMIICIFIFSNNNVPYYEYVPFLIYIFIYLSVNIGMILFIQISKFKKNLNKQEFIYLSIFIYLLIGLPFIFMYLIYYFSENIYNFLNNVIQIDEKIVENILYSFTNEDLLLLLASFIFISLIIDLILNSLLLNSKFLMNKFYPNSYLGKRIKFTKKNVILYLEDTLTYKIFILITIISLYVYFIF